jgi:hypothetical protein
LARLLSAVKAKPNDAALSKALVLLYVLKLDKPAEAVPYVEAAMDEALKTYVPLAAKEAGTLDEEALKGLGACTLTRGAG